MSVKASFDKWTGNCDGRQAVFTKRAGEPGYLIYESVTSWESFEPILSRIEEIEYADLWRCAAKIPYEWYEHDGEGLFQLVETL